MSKARKISSFGKGIPESEYKKALIYCRVSSDRQKTEGHGLESQEQRCREFALKNNYEVSEVFKDSFSGGGDFMNRPAMRNMLEYIDKNKHINFVVIFDDLKRFARDTAFHLKLRTTFKAKDVLLKCLNYNFEDTPEGEFVETILAAQGQLEKEQNKRQVVQKQKSRLELGYWAFGSKKGYKQTKDPLHGTLSIPTKESEILREALEGFAMGRFQRKIDVCRFLVEKGFWKKQRPEKYIDKFTAVARDCFYMGDIEYLPWEVSRRKGKHQGIITLEVFDLIQKRLNKEDSGKRIRIDLSEDFPLRSLVNCCECKNPLTGAWSKGRNSRYPYYFYQHKDCINYSKTIRKEKLELDFDSFIKKQKLNDEVSKVVSIIFERSWNEEVSTYKNSTNIIKNKSRVLEEKISQLTDRLISAKTEGIQRGYESQIEKAQNEIDQLNAVDSRQTDLSVPYRTALDKAVTLLKNPYKIWSEVDVIEKQKLFYFIFEDNIAYSKKDGYRTAQKTYAIRLFEEFVDSNSLDVDTRRNLLNRLKDYLKRFWEYYESSPAMQKALISA